MRILVTGSRSWTDYIKVSREIVRYISENGVMGVDSEGLPVDWDTSDVVIMHGACPLGADALAEEYAICHWIEQEEYPADWKKHGKAAGFVRNSQMVHAHPDVCLAFINPCRKQDCPKRKPHGTHGASHCADLAESHGIEVRRFGESVD